MKIEVKIESMGEQGELERREIAKNAEAMLCTLVRSIPIPGGLKVWVDGMIYGRLSERRAATALGTLAGRYMANNKMPLLRRIVFAFDAARWATRQMRKLRRGKNNEG